MVAGWPNLTLQHLQSTTHEHQSSIHLFIRACADHGELATVLSLIAASCPEQYTLKSISISHQFIQHNQQSSIYSCMR
jgi:hypothetical protein